MSKKTDTNLYTNDREIIPLLDKSHTTFLDKSVLIFGGSSSGKTTLVEDILHTLRDHIPNFIVVAPKTSDSFYRSKLPARCIFEDLSKEKWNAIWQRQVNATQCYKIANNLKYMEEVFNYCSSPSDLAKIESVQRSAKRYINEVEANPTLEFGQKKAQRTAIEELTEKGIKSVYAEAIRANSSMLLKKLTDKTHLTVIKFLDFNPRLCLVIDDMSEAIKGWEALFKKEKENPIACMFFKGRHNYITLILAAHDDKFVETEYRKNARLTIYTTSQSFISGLDRKGNSYSNAEKKKAMHYATKVFGDGSERIRTYQKLCYLRDDPHPFQYVIATQHNDFRLGSAPLTQLAESIPSTDDSIEKNPFIRGV